MSAITRFLAIHLGKLTSSLDANAQKIENLATPTADTDAATKKYCDEHGGGGTENVIEKVKRNGIELPVVDKTVNVTVPTSAADVGAAAASHLTDSAAHAALLGLKRDKTDLNYAVPLNFTVVSTGPYDSVVPLPATFYGPVGGDRYSMHADAYVDGSLVQTITLDGNQDPVQPVLNLTLTEIGVTETHAQIRAHRASETDTLALASQVSGKADASALTAEVTRATAAEAGKLDKTGGTVSGSITFSEDNTGLVLPVGSGSITGIGGGMFISPSTVFFGNKAVTFQQGTMQKTENIVPSTDLNTNDDTHYPSIKRVIAEPSLLKFTTLATAWTVDYALGHAFTIGDFVSYNAHFYCCKVNVSGELSIPIPPDQDTAHWNDVTHLSSLFTSANTSLMGVVRYSNGGSSSATMADRTTNVYTLNATGSTVTLTFPEAVEGKMRDFLLDLTYTAGTLQLPEGVTKVGDDLTFTTGKEYLLAFTEISANRFYVRSIEIA